MTELFDIGDEFRITDEMEEGKIYNLNKDAYVKIRAFQSKTYLKGIRKVRQDNPDLTDAEALVIAIAEYGIVEIVNVTIDGELVENTFDSKLAALKYGGEGESGGHFLRKILEFASAKNYEGAGKSLLNA